MRTIKKWISFKVRTINMTKIREILEKYANKCYEDGDSDKKLLEYCIIKNIKKLDYTKKK